jgi:hypothetical protein
MRAGFGLGGGRTVIMKTLFEHFCKFCGRTVRPLGRWSFWFLPVILLCSCATKSNQKVSHDGIVPAISAPQTLQFLGETYVARYSACESDMCMVEYFQASEGEKSWKKLLSLRLNLTGMDGRQLVENTENSVKAAGASAVRSFKGKNKNEYGIEFTMMSHDVVELDVFRIVNRTKGTGTVSFQYAEKIPFEKLRAIGEAKLPDYYAGIRKKVVNAMDSTPMPVIEMVPK